jgi:ABC-type antimicrobial peptide transport system permease subunit
VSAAAINKVPILDRFQDWGIWPASRPPATPEDTFNAMARWVTPGYFKTMGIPMLAGRDISARDVAGAPQVIVISEKTARRLFPDQNPVGQAVRVWSTTGTFEVVGVVGDARLNLMLGDPDPAMYMSADQSGNTATRIVIKTTGDPAQLATPLREIVRARDRTVPLARLMPMSEVVDEGLSMFRVVGLSLGMYSGVALLLTAIGLFGALAYHVSQQEGELSVRLAMGATPVGLLGRVLRRGLTLAGAGLAIGAAASVPSARLLEQLPFTLQVQGSSNLALVLGGLCIVAIAASLIPAWRVTRINPVDALRKE